MGNSDSRDALPPINFAALAEALLSRAHDLVLSWLPGGVLNNREYKCGSLSGGKGRSFSVNLDNGRWADFNTEDKGGDLISLYAKINGLDMGKAAVEIARKEGLEDVANIRVVSGPPGETSRQQPPRPEPIAKPPKSDEGWVTVTLVPPDAPKPTFRHHYRQPQDIEHTATYMKDGWLMGYVVRFRTSDGGKDTLPYTWCTSARDGASKWHWRTWDEPRPLYFPLGTTPSPTAHTVILVEGEKKAGILQDLLEQGAPGVYIVVSWAGGCKAWKKASWQWIAGCHVVMWPDCDGKREPLTKAEKAQCLDEAALKIAAAMKPTLPVDKQPGMAAMLGIGAALQSLDCKIHLLPIPEPLEVIDGWDCADAIAVDGWDFTRVIEFFGKAQPLPEAKNADIPNAATEQSGGKKNRSPVSTGGDDSGTLDGEGDRFQGHINYLCDQLKCNPWDLPVNRKLVIAALRKAPGLEGCLGLNELTGAPSTKVAWPWRDDPAPLIDADDLRLGDYLSSTYKIKAASRASLTEAIEMVADERRFHPIRDWLKNLKHDGKSRIDDWLIFVLGKEDEDLPPKLRRYLQLVGRYLLMGLVARVMEPGCKFDYSPVFEGLPGRGKSTFVETLVGKDFFSDTHFDVGSGKDGMEQLEGLWGYELSELTALRKADSEQIKQFFSSTTDRFRGAYGKFVKKHPRQCVIFCSTNKKRYLYDLTGNRRFWPIWIDKFIKLDWLRSRRDQLFAEALALYLAGKRYYPSIDEEDEYFVPQQMKRMVETAVQSRLYELLTREGSPGGEDRGSKEINIHTKFISLDRLVSALGSDAAKSTSLLEQQVRGWLESNGWEYKRAGKAPDGEPRPYGYRQPKLWPPMIKDDEDEEDERPPGDTFSPDGSPAQGLDHEEADDAPF